MYKKLLLIMICIVPMVTNAAQGTFESQKSIGLEIGTSAVKGGESAELVDTLSNGKSFGLNFGAQNIQWRTSIVFNYFDNEERKVNKFFLALDYFILPADTELLASLRPYLGANIGYLNYQHEIENVDSSGMTYGVQAGVMIDYLESFYFDVGYRYSTTNLKEFKNANDIFLGVHYKY